MDQTALPCAVKRRRKTIAIDSASDSGSDSGSGTDSGDSALPCSVERGRKTIAIDSASDSGSDSGSGTDSGDSTRYAAALCDSDTESDESFVVSDDAASESLDYSSSSESASDSEESSCDADMSVAEEQQKFVRSQQAKDATPEGYGRARVLYNIHEHIKAVQPPLIALCNVDDRAAHDVDIDVQSRPVVISMDKRTDATFEKHLMPLLLSITGVEVIADICGVEEELAPAWLSGFKQFFKLSFPVGHWGTIGCFCCQKHLRNLYAVSHARSDILFMVGSSCVDRFGHSRDDVWREFDAPKMPPWLRHAYVGGSDEWAVNEVATRG